MHEKCYPKQAHKLDRPNPQLVAREILECAGFARTELDAVLPTLENAERNQILGNQLKPAVKQNEWKTPQ